LLTSLQPVTSKTKPSIPKITARATMAPITPATALEMPPEDEVDDAEVPDGAELEVEEHPVLELPQALHQDVSSPIANLFISVTKVFHGITVSCWPNNGYAVRGLADVVPLAKRKRTDISSLEGYELLDTVAFVTSSKVMDEA
jgi:hypothetical protein